MEEEPNDGALSANQVAIGDSVDGTISLSTDADYFKFEAVPGDTVEIIGSDRNASGLYGSLVMFGGGGNQIDQSQYFGSQYRQRIVHTFGGYSICFIRYSFSGNYANFPYSQVSQGEDLHRPHIPVPPAANATGGAQGSPWTVTPQSSVSPQLSTQSPTAPAKPQAYDNGDYRIRVRKFVSTAPDIMWGVGWQSLRSTSFWLTASVVPNALPTSVMFEYGTTTGYGASVLALEGEVNGINQVTVSTGNIEGLLPNTTYHVRVTATNSKGTTVSSDGWIQTPPSAQGWVEQSSGTETYLEGVAFADANNGLVVGGSGVILRTTDGGATWNQQGTGSTTTYIAVAYRDALHATVVGGDMVRTTDGGISWTAQSPVGEWLRSVAYADSNNGTAVGGNGTVLRTTDGGSSWFVQNVSTTNYLTGVTYADAKHGTIVGQSGLILHSTNGGENWTSQTSGIGEDLAAVSFADSNVGIATGYNNFFIRTTDGGSTWLPVSLSGWTSLRGVVMLDATTAFAVGSNGTILKSTNAGGAWTACLTGTSDWLYAIARSGAGSVSAVGEWGTILRSTSYISLIAPNGGEEYRVGKTKTINWTGSGMANVAIDYRTSDVGSWKPIAASVPASTGTYGWAVPNDTSSRCWVKVS